MEPLDGVPSIDQQREFCRRTATALGAEVVGEFTDWQLTGPRPGLHQLLQLVCSDPGIDHLIVTSRDRLAVDIDQAFDIAWLIGSTGTVVVTINTDDESVMGATEPSQT
jgi:DNA invertase Pin-like site-specific DNA recombinase